MDNCDEKYKVEDTPKVNINRTIEILRTYIEKEKEITRAFDEEDGIDVNDPNYEPEADAINRKLKNILGYREIRTLQAYASKLARGDYTKDTRSKLVEMDKARRSSHNLALANFKGLVEFGKKYGLESLYDGALLTDQEIERHTVDTLDVRKEMTDAFLKMLVDIDKTPYSLVDNKEISVLKNKIEKVDRDYKVSKAIEHDDDDVEFEDFNDKYRGFGEIG